VQDRLYESAEGSNALIAESADVPLAAARLLGHDVAATIGAVRLAELRERWPGDLQLLLREFGFAGATWPREVARRRSLVEAMTRGLTERTGESQTP
jgi:predicted nucleotidyltransferase